MTFGPDTKRDILYAWMFMTLCAMTGAVTDSHAIAYFDGIAGMIYVWKIFLIDIQFVD